MKNIKISFVFNEGKIRKYNVSGKDPEFISIVQVADAILRPTINQKKISGKIILTLLNDRLRITYVNIKPAEFNPVLMNLFISYRESRLR